MEGKPVQLSQYRGKWVVLYFYPKADTPGCTAQGKEHSRLYDKFLSNKAVVFGVSIDDKGEVAKAYGVKLFFGMYSRDTILINPEGKVEKIYRGVDPKGDPNQVLSYITSKAKSY
jgi:peroxiredoxin Q/BCP